MFDAADLTDAVEAFHPDLVMHQLTDLPDTVEQIPKYAWRNHRIRTEGTRNLLGAAKRAGAVRLLAQCIAWTSAGAGEAMAEHERLVLDAGRRRRPLWTVLCPDRAPSPPRVHVDDAVRGTRPLLEAPSGVVVLADQEHG